MDECDALIPIAAVTGNLPSVLVADDVEAAGRYVAAAAAPSTQRAYAGDWSIYTAWCQARGFQALPSKPAQVALFLSHEADRGRAVSTIERRLAAIGHYHKMNRLPAPTAMEDAVAIAVTMQGIRRTIGAAPRKKSAATHDLVRRVLDAIPETGLANLRDRALLAMGLASAMRRSELVEMRVEHLTLVPDGVEILIPKSKTDQEAHGHTIAVPRGLRIRPLAALEAWMTAAQIRDGFVYRRLLRGGKVSAKPLSGGAVALIVKRRLEAVGEDPAQFAAHSLRSGFLTSAAMTGANIFKMRDQSRHESMDVLAGYIHAADRFRDHAGAGFL